MVTISRRPSGNPTKGAHLIGWLGHDAQAASVLATAQLHLKLRAVVEQALPAAMRGAFDVLKIEQSTLTLMVNSAAFAAKFRQLAPRVTAHIQAAGWNLVEIKLRVQGGLGIPVAVQPAKEARALDQQDLKTFEVLNQQLRPGPLADAVARLLAHHQASAAPPLKPASTLGETPMEPAPQTRK
jgi:hypothetical protein